MDVLTVYVTAGSEDEARKLARTAVGERLAACANLLPPITSVFRWTGAGAGAGDRDGAVQEEAEWALLLKTRAGLFDRLGARLTELHSYEVPCIVAWPVVCGHEPYLDWVREETS